MRSKLWVILVLLLLLFGCSSSSDEGNNVTVLTETKEGEYTYIIPFESSDTRSYHGTYQSHYDIIEIGVGLEDYSKSNFPTDDYYVQEGQIIDREMLLNLVSRESDTNTQGLNPSKGASFLTGNGDESIVDPVIVTDVFELDFVKKSKNDFDIDGITLAIIVNKNQTITVDGVDQSYTITDDRLWEYASNAGRKLESYMRTIEGISDMPICILIYSTASSDATLPGGYLGSGYFTGRTGQFTHFSEKWYLIPTTEANNIDSDTYNKLINMKSALKEFLPESINIMGQAKYIDGEISLLKIQITVQGKTYAEIKALTQYCTQLIRDFSEDMRIIVNIKDNDEVVSVIERLSGSDTSTTTYLN